jgi:superfamily II DNA or RNA helicase
MWRSQSATGHSLFAPVVPFCACATPERLDGRGLGEIFDNLIEAPSTADLIETGWLSRFVCYMPAAAPDLSTARFRGGDFAAEDIRDAMDGVVIQ